jgi:peptidoglycan/LPS O-acetylase OafA/YrhL
VQQASLGRRLAKPDSAGAVPDVVAPPPHHPRFPLLDGMRAVAVLSVVLVHVSVFASAGTTPVPRVLMHMNVGVTIFFLISGFLLYRPFIAHRAGGAAAPPVGQYAKRRALRIFPAYWLVLTVLTILPWTVGVSGGEWLTQYTLTQTIPFTSDPNSCSATIDCGLSQTWSLVVELTFYATLPFWFLLTEQLARGRTRRGWVALELCVLAALGATSVILHFAVLEGGVHSVVGGTVIGYGLWFALGMALAVGSVALDGRPRPWCVRLLADTPWVPWLGALGVYAALCAFLPATPFLLNRADQLWAHLGFAAVALLLMLPAVFADDAGGLPRAFLRLPLVAWLGLISYGIFLWHYAVAFELGNRGDDFGFWPLLAATLAISIAVAAASYYLLERPVLKFKYRRARRVETPAT